MAIVNTAKPLFRDELRRAPAHPLGTRVFVRPNPIAAQSEGGLVIPDSAKMRQMSGVLVAVGDGAADKLWDLGVEIGDEIWYGKYAGIIEEWQHIVRDGEGKCTHDTVWEIVPRDDRRWSAAGLSHDEAQLRSCRGCGALKLCERVIIMDADDLVCDVDLQVRLEAGVVQRIQGTTSDGKTRYFIVRPDERADKFEFTTTKESR